MQINLGDYVMKPLDADFRFEGEVVAVFKKHSGAERIVVENRDGILHIFSPHNVVKT